MPKALAPEVRASIEEAIREGYETRNQIARRLHVSGSTVTKIAGELQTRGQLDSPAFDRTQTKNATEAKLVDLSARRAALASALLGDAELLRERQWRAQHDTVRTEDGGVDLVERPTNAGEFRNFSIAIGVYVDKMRALTDGADQTAKAVSLLERLMDHVDAE